MLEDDFEWIKDIDKVALYRKLKTYKIIKLKMHLTNVLDQRPKTDEQIYSENVGLGTQNNIRAVVVQFGLGHQVYSYPMNVQACHADDPCSNLGDRTKFLVQTHYNC